MTTVDEYKKYGEELEELLSLETHPIAVKMLKNKQEIPEEAIRPKKDRDYHLAQCQTFALTRRRGETIAMLKEDNWCWAPLIGYGLVEVPEFFTGGDIFYPHFAENREDAKELAEDFPRFERDKYIGILSAPLKNTSFKPDLVLIYSNNGQLRSILFAVKYKEGSSVPSEFDSENSCIHSPIPMISGSCIHSTVPLMQGDKYLITVPDPGEYERAMTDENKIIFSLTEDKIENLIQGLRHMKENIELGYDDLIKVMRPDYPRPEFYKELFKKWGLDVED